MKDHELRFSDTNSADDSEGKTWGLDANLFWCGVGGMMLGFKARDSVACPAARADTPPASQ